MTESQVVNEWIDQGVAKGTLGERRRKVLEALSFHFPGAATDEVVRLVNEQDSLPLLDDWFWAALRAPTFEQFVEVLRR